MYKALMFQHLRQSKLSAAVKPTRRARRETRAFSDPGPLSLLVVLELRLCRKSFVTKHLRRDGIPDRL